MVAQCDEHTSDTVELLSPPIRQGWLVELGSPECVHRVVLRAGDGVVVGASRAADIRVQDETVSATHCELRATPSGLTCRDLGSTNGIYVAGARVSEACLTQAGASLVLGRTVVTVRVHRGEEREADEGEALPGMVGHSRPMQRLAREVRKFAQSRLPVLIQGESGTGKDLVAAALHKLSGRSGEYVALNAGGLPESLADAELFGHVRGAFTGAVGVRRGAFEQATQGTLFLDEVADLSAQLQVKLLRAVEGGWIRPLGSTGPIQVDVRIVSASWADLEARSSKGGFRQDLFHRLSTLVLKLPPLRDRKGDIPALAVSLLERHHDDFGDKCLDPAALGLLADYQWPGNIRQLDNVLSRAASYAPGRQISAEHVATALPAQGAASHRRRQPDPLELLAQAKGNMSAAARAAGVPRSTFRSWLARGTRRSGAGSA